MNANKLRLHWILLVAPVILLIDLAVARYAKGQFDQVLEAGLLFDLAIVVPGLYWLCYREQGRRTIPRAVALACLGIWLAFKLVPEAERDLVLYVGPLRYVGVGLLVALELVLVLGIYRSVFSGKSAEEALVNAPKDMPAWLARLIAMEASFWHKALKTLKRIFSRS